MEDKEMASHGRARSLSARYSLPTRGGQINVYYQSLCLTPPVSSQVDHFPLLERALSSLGYEGHFVSKPDSPCIYLPSNSGPDGCALFYKKDQWEVVGEVQSKTLEVFNITWHYYIKLALHCVPKTRAVSCSFV